MKKAILAVMTAVATTTAPVFAGNTFDEHIDLVKALGEVGVDVHMNIEGPCDDSSNNGVYFPWKKTLVVCQDNSKYNGGELVPFTDNDLDTIRHEAWHVIQDCRDGSLGGDLIPVLYGKTRQQLFDQSGMTGRRRARVTRLYTEQGANAEIITLEHEAVAAASYIPASLIAQGVRETCQ